CSRAPLAVPVPPRAASKPLLPLERRLQQAFLGLAGLGASVLRGAEATELHLGAGVSGGNTGAPRPGASSYSTRIGKEATGRTFSPISHLCPSSSFLP
ncbi:unnamed protein product, partial [Gulo gulo]